jgi:hypothetical protein
MRLAPERQRQPLDLQSRFGGCGLHHLDRLGHDFETNVVAQQNSYFQHEYLSNKIGRRDAEGAEKYKKRKNLIDNSGPVFPLRTLRLCGKNAITPSPRRLP